MSYEGLTSGVVILVLLIMSLSVHEYAHALSAYIFGDNTAKLAGRMTLNPLAHWDRVGTSLLAGLVLLNSIGLNLPVFGWGKPVPVNENRLRNPKYDGIQVALAGPMSNFILAAIFAILFRFLPLNNYFQIILLSGALMNIFLMFFNLLPIPPLDGSSLLRLILPMQVYIRLATNPAMWFFFIFMIFSFALGPIESLSYTLLNFLAGR